MNDNVRHNDTATHASVDDDVLIRDVSDEALEVLAEPPREMAGTLGTPTVSILVSCC